MKPTCYLENGMLRVVDSPEKFISQVISWKFKWFITCKRFPLFCLHWGMENTRDEKLYIFSWYLLTKYDRNGLIIKYNSSFSIEKRRESIWIHWKRSRTGALLSIHHRHRPHQQKDSLYNIIHLSLSWFRCDDGKMDTIVLQ